MIGRRLRIFGTRRTLSSQLLALQLLIIVAVLVVISGLSLAQASATFQREQGLRVQSAAENLAASPTVRQLLASAQPRIRTALQGAVESVRAVSGLDYAQLTDPDGIIVVATDPSRVGQESAAEGAGARTGRSWTGLAETSTNTAVAPDASVQSQVPVLDADGRIVGVAIVGREYPSVWERLAQSTPDLVVYLAVASVLGAVGSILLARRVKRQTMGMEAGEIVDLVRQRQAMLEGLKEAVVALDPSGRVVLLSRSAHDMLGLDEDGVGRRVDELGLDDRVLDVLRHPSDDGDQLVLTGDRILVFNTVPIEASGRKVATVTTFRDRTELSEVQSKLDISRTSSTALREHIHEFDNQLHTISGLVQLGEYDEVERYVDGITEHRERLTSTVTDRIDDLGVAALLIAKIGAAAARSVTVALDDASHLPRLDDDASRDLCTVVGNLVDNAVDAVLEDQAVDAVLEDQAVDAVVEQNAADAVVRVRIVADADGIEVEVADNGPGIETEDADRVFEQGWSTKGTSLDGHGFGLALVRVVCRRRGGDVSVSDRVEDGTRWTVFRAVTGSGGRAR
ncbi:sensor histidine kinase [Rhodococcus sp. BP-349]|uniref:sensor histidine kinase n=1 Tax=unclassified Rhodococcus (in: high G+C Gram-positive bacteria) TaxID=192944 RepID=UPI001C9B31A5|nr:MULTISPECIES: sensor histidine kinase [unclassified Rhodococcus (in: high G+C Gram-positive bacteria)]MBY6537178.1 sensor histidine kinase [Rhodococcus sp. BP-363]MBY6541515.1 sensor histidine kinase [Rhodococcus sp. BP-369]MBY6560745.1 sensor histidine kinase [Rhodococcus sp. BP-370]MBY6575037.1 sensor histidine kinase [Rhodococcus sp. BP-364]MBY6584338.1 sensor histidine kinase [Rhodococcus sp. BP-358]